MSMVYFSVDDDHVQMSLREVERELLIGFFRQVRAILMERAAEVGHTETFDESVGAEDEAQALLATLEQQSRPLPPPDDPVIARLLPSGRRDFTANAGQSAIEFRRLTEHDLRSAKLRDAERASELVRDEPIELSLDDANVVLRALNDVRLSLGARLDVDEDTPYPHKILTEQDQALAIYFWTGGLQEELLEAICELDPLI